MRFGCYSARELPARRRTESSGRPGLRRAAGIRRLLGARQALAIGLAALVVSCDGGTQPEVSPERWAARYRGGKPIWVRESTLPKEPQKTPRMIIYEVSQYAPGTRPSREQTQAARDLVDRCFEAAKRNGWFQFGNGLDQGYRLLFGDKRHYVNPAFVFDDAVLDCNRPEFLMYYDTPAGKGLAGLMFYADTPTGWGEQLAGPLTIWHYHVWAPVQCLRRRLLLVGTANTDGRCASGVPMHRSPEMIHVWFIDRPRGPFASSMRLRDEEIAMLTETRSAPPLRIEAALGLPAPRD